jgi:putative transposase
MDFVYDQLFDGTRFRCLTVVDIFTRECLIIEVGKQLRGEDVVDAMNKVIQKRTKPSQIFLDNVLTSESTNI